MSQDRYVKVVLTVIAVALCLIAVALFDVPQVARAVEGRLDAESDDGNRSLQVPALRGAQYEGQPLDEPTGLAPRAPTSTLPVRWRIPFARHVNTTTAGFMDCATVVSVVGSGPDPITVEVEFFDNSGGSLGLTSFLLDTPGEPDTHVTDLGVDINPFGGSLSANTGGFVGYGLVLADDPRIFVGAYLVCSEEGGGLFPRLITNLSAYPVGQTSTFFQAGIPQTILDALAS